MEIEERRRHALELAKTAIGNLNTIEIMGDDIGMAFEDILGIYDILQNDISIVLSQDLEAAKEEAREVALSEAADDIDFWEKAGADEPVHPSEISEWLRARSKASPGNGSHAPESPSDTHDAVVSEE